MSNSTAHIEITYKNDEDSPEITSWYAVTPEVKRAWEFWLAGQATPPSVEAMEAWFDKNEVDFKRDRADGPAVIMKFSDGSWMGEWWVDGNIQRELDVNANGSQREVWFTNNEVDRADGPAIVARDRDGTILYEEWYRNGVLDPRESSPRSPTRPTNSPAP